VLPVSPAVTGAIWLFGLAWLAVNWWMFKNERHPALPKIRQADIYVRYVVMAAMALLGLFSLLTGAPVTAPWLAAKMFLFAGVMALGVYLRAEVKQWIIGFGMVRQGGATVDNGNTI